MESGDHPNFSSREDEVCYWKNLAKKFMQEKTNLQHELDEYMEESKQLEKELETALDQAEKTNRELTSDRHRLEGDIESLKMKLDQMTQDITMLQTELTSKRVEIHQQNVYIRELEQKNDDLERAHRIVAESMVATESTLNTAIERNAILESEVVEKEQLEVRLQRLLDETRDLKQEIKVKDHTFSDNDRNIMNGNLHSPIDSNRITNDTEKQVNNIQYSTPIKRETTVNGTGMTPSARHSALNIVSDILRRITVLEAKVAPYRAHNKELGLNHSRESSRNRRISSRGQASPSVQGVLH